MDTSSFQHYLIGLLAIGNNVSALGAFLLHTQGMPRNKVKRLILMSSLACLIMLVGTRILDFFGISVSAFQIAGGLLLGGVGLEMMNSRSPLPVDAAATEPRPSESHLNDAQFYSAAVVPIGIPLTIGAGTLSAVVLFAETANRTGTLLSLLAAIVILVLVNTAIFRFSSRIMAWLGAIGVTIFIKLMGLFTLAIGVEFLTKGLGAIYLNLRDGALASLG
jgi:multiple antibiotic resistance protein